MLGLSSEKHKCWVLCEVWGVHLLFMISILFPYPIQVLLLICLEVLIGHAESLQVLPKKKIC